VGLVAVAAVAMALLVMAVTNGNAGTTELVQAKLHQNLMSAAADSSDSDTPSLSSGSGGSTGWYGHWSDGGSSSSASSPNWAKQLQKMQARATARRAREDQKFFSGVDKAFGKKAAKGMLAAFNGKGKNVLTKFKLNEKKLAIQKAKIADNTVVPSHKHAAHHKIIAKHQKSADAKKTDTKADAKKSADPKKAEVKQSDDTKKADAKKDTDSKTADVKKDDSNSKKADAKKAAAEKTASKLAAKKIDHAVEAKKDAEALKTADVKKEALKVAQKMAAHTDPSADKKAASKPDSSLKKADAKKSDDSKTADAKEEASVVKEALKVAHNMDKHIDPVYKKPVKKVVKEDDSKSAAAKPAVDKHPTAKNLQHQGLLADAHKMQKLVNEFKNAKGPEKKQLKARVMELQQDITSDTKAVDHYAHRARTAFARETQSAEAKHKGGKDSSKKAAHASRRDMSDEQRLKADGWH